MTASVSLSVAEQLAITIERGGGTMTLAGDSVDLFLPDELAHLLPDLREHKREIMTLLRRLGGRIAHFPRCPKCGGYWLHREGNVGPYECQRCGLQEIEESAARIASFLAELRIPQEVM